MTLITLNARRPNSAGGFKQTRWRTGRSVAGGIDMLVRILIVRLSPSSIMLRT